MSWAQGEGFAAAGSSDAVPLGLVAGRASEGCPRVSASQLQRSRVALVCDGSEAGVAGSPDAGMLLANREGGPWMLF